METTVKNTNNQSHLANCSCESTSLSITGQPLFRAVCHCTTCQTFNQSAYADVTVFRAADVEIADPDQVDFKTYQKPPMVQRGKCISCGDPSIENVSLPLMPNLKIIPSNLLPEGLKRDVECHIFYHRRLKDIDDNRPKHSSFISSQLAFMKVLFRSLRKK